MKTKKDTNKKREKLYKKKYISFSSYFSILSSIDIKEIIEKYNNKHWPRLLKLIKDVDLRRKVISHFENKHLNKLNMTSEDLAYFSKKINPDNSSNLIDLFYYFNRSRILNRLRFNNKREIQELLKYPLNVAGGIMQLECIQVLEITTIKKTLLKVKDLIEDDFRVSIVWIVDKKNKIKGSVALIDLLLNKETTPVSKIMDLSIITIQPLLQKEKIIDLFKQYDIISLPVVDNENRLLGTVFLDDVMDFKKNPIKKKKIKRIKVKQKKEPEKKTIFSMIKYRFPWLSLGLFSSFLSASLLYSFEILIQKAFFLFSFIPVISAMGGSVGLQVSTILISSLSVKEMNINNLTKVLYREIGIGLIMGFIISFGSALYAMLILSDKNIIFAYIVFISMFLTISLSTTIGVIIPFLFKRLNIDPAIASGPFLATTLDIFSIFIYMMTSSLFLYYNYL